MTLIATTIVWTLVGVAAGYGVRVLSVWLARKEGLDPGFERWKVIGPPVATAIFFGAFGFLIGPHPYLLLASLWCALLVQVIFFDLEYRLILDRLIFPSMALALVLSLFRTPWWAGLATGVAAGLLFLLIAVLGSVLMKAEAMGFGDVKFAAFVGLLLGFPGAVSALFLGVVLAGIVAFLAVILRAVALKGSLAYGPYLALGTIIVLYQYALGPPS